MSTVLAVYTLKIPIAEFECSYARSSGPGGQNVNKVNSKCILRWPVIQSPSLPIEVRSRFIQAYGSKLTKDGDMIVMSDRFRDQNRNYEDCLEKLTDMLKAIYYPPKARRKTKPSRGSKQRAYESKKSHSAKKALRQKF